jgi:hypothetical protein
LTLPIDEILNSCAAMMCSLSMNEALWYLRKP